jgi:tetratricopeptide (TPR) repeat protein
LDQRKGWRAAERLLKQGKVQAALQQLSKISDTATGDVVTLNRLADLLAQQGKASEAIGYYEKIAKQFETGGFVPKSIAIHKKILRLDPKRIDSAILLGQLYGRQKLHGEARKYLLHAANNYVEARKFDKAREVFEHLVEAEPDELRHRVRLAESRAAEGDTARAVEDLVIVGQSFLDGGAVGEAQTIFEHAAELDSGSDGALIGSARCHEAQGAPETALQMLESRAGAAEATPVAVGELARMYEAAGRSAEALDLLRKTSLLEIRSDTWEGMFRSALERDGVDALWERMDPLFAGMNGDADSARLIEILARLVQLEPEGHIPALLRQARLHEDCGEVRNAVRALDALAAAYRARSMDQEAARVLERMREVAPPGEEAGTPAPHVARDAEPARPAPAPAAAPRSIEKLPDDAEAPAVPLNPSEEEFAAGRITQAEVLEKYDLLPQALEQLEEVVERFPGHAVAQERRVDMLRALERAKQIPAALTALAVARRVAGDIVGAKKVANEAASMPTLPTVSRRLLERMQLIRPPASSVTADPGATAAVLETPAPQTPIRTTPGEAAEPAIEHTSLTGPEPATVAPTPQKSEAAPAATAGGEVVIDLDADDDDPIDEAPGVTPAPDPAPSEPSRVAGPEMIADIRHELSKGSVQDARRRFDALTVLGYSGPEIEALRADVATAEAAAAGAADGPEPRTEGDDDLSAIHAALQEELDEEDIEPVLSDESCEQGVSEILAAFRERVEEEVGAEDHRTHYELGIGFKEMGLTEEAIQEFRIAVDAPELKSEASAMIALCHRESQEMEDAATWYRAALEACPEGGETTPSLRYDLAEVLLEAGDAQAALDQFRGVMESDPTFRDVRGRVSELETRLHS